MPLFKYEGKILCPSCKREFEITENGVVIVKEISTKKENKEEEEMSKGQKSEKEKLEEQKEKKEDAIEKHIKENAKEDVEDVKEILRCCIVSIIKEYLKDCKDLMVLERVADILNKLLIILEKLEEKKF